MASKGQKLRILKANDCYVGLTSGEAGYVSCARDDELYSLSMLRPPGVGINISVEGWKRYKKQGTVLHDWYELGVA
jgi:hypothetical protein